MPFILFLFSEIFFFTAIAEAQVTTIFDVSSLAYTIADKLNILLWVVAIAVFFWGLVKFIQNASDTSAHEEGKKLIIWGLLSFVVLISLWGFVDILINTFVISIAPVDYIDKNGSVIPG